MQCQTSIKLLTIGGSGGGYRPRKLTFYHSVIGIIIFHLSHQSIMSSSSFTIADHQKFVDYINKHSPGVEHKPTSHEGLIRILFIVHYLHNKGLGGSTSESTCECICGKCRKASKAFKKSLQMVLLNRGNWNFADFMQGFTLESTVPIVLTYECGCETCENPGDSQLRYTEQMIHEIDCKGGKCRISYENGYGLHCTACYGDYETCVKDDINGPREEDDHCTYYIQRNKIRSASAEKLSFTCSGNKCRLDGCEACFG